MKAGRGSRKAGWRLLAVAVLAGWSAVSLRAQLVSTVPPGGTTPFNNIAAVDSDANGNAYVLESISGVVTQIAPNGNTARFAGGGVLVLDPLSQDFERRQGESFRLNLAGAQGMRFGSDGNLYISDTLRARIIRITREPRPGFEGAFMLVGRVWGGNGRTGFFEEGDTSFLVALNQPGDLAFDSAGNIYIADTGNFRVVRITPTGVVTVVAGNGSEGYSGDGGLGSNAQIHAPRGLAVDLQGNLYISTYDLAAQNSRVRKLDAQGIISTVAGTGISGFAGDSGPATGAQLKLPAGLAVDANNTLYIADSQNHRIRIITPTQKIQTAMGTGDPSDNGEGRQAADTAISNPRALRITANGDLLVGDAGNFRVLRVVGMANAPRISLDTVTPNPLIITPGGSAQRMDITVTRFNFSGNIGFTVAGLPNGVSGGVLSPGTTNSGAVILSATSSALPSSYTVNLNIFTANNQGDILNSFNVTLLLVIAPQPTLVVNPPSLTFSAVASGSNPATQTITISDAAFGFIGWGALASTSTGGNWLSVTPASGNHTNPLIVGVNIQGLAAGTYTGNVQVSSPGAIGTPRNVPVTLTLSPPPPTIGNNGVLNNASYGLALLTLAPGSIAAIFGNNLTNGTSCLPPGCGPTLDASGRLGTTMAGASVTVNGVASPLFYATPTQLGIQIPAELGPGAVEVRVTVEGRQSAPSIVAIAPTSPGIFTVSANGTGNGAITHADGSLVTALNPARPGELLVMYATGLGGTAPAVPTGMLPTEASAALAPVLVLVDGRDVEPVYAGLAGCCAGLNQINFRVPENVRTNTVVSVNINSGGRLANSVSLNIGVPLPPQQP